MPRAARRGSLAAKANRHNQRERKTWFGWGDISAYEVNFMNEFILIVGFAVLPALGNFIGAVIAEKVDTPRWTIGAALHGAAGIAIALVSLEMLPFILASLPVSIFAIGFVIGAGASLLVAKGIVLWQNGGQIRATQAFMVYTVIGADLFSDGLMTGAGGAVALEVGLLLAGAQLFANVPGGFAAAGNLKHYRIPVGRRLAAAALAGTPALLSAIVGYAVFRHAAPETQAFALSVIAGILLLATIEDMVPEGDAPRPPRWSSTLAFAIGFAAMAVTVSSV